MKVLVDVTAENPRRSKHLEPLLKTLLRSTVIASEIVAEEDDSNVQPSIRMNGCALGLSCTQKTPRLPMNRLLVNVTSAPFSTRTCPLKSTNDASKTPPLMSIIGGKAAGAFTTICWACLLYTS